MSILLSLVSMLFVVQSQFCCDERTMYRAAEDASVVVVAQIIDVAPYSEVLSHFHIPTQRVSFQVEEVLKGDLKSREFIVGFYVVQKIPGVEADGTELSSSIYRKGNRMLLFLEADPGLVAGLKEEKRPVFISPALQCSSVIADESRVQSVQKFIDRKVKR